MALRSDEIGEILKARIADFEAPVVDAQEGVITSVFDGIARIYGLEKAMAGELLQFPGNVVGLALDLREDGVGAAIMGPYEHLQEGDVVRTTGRVAQVPVGDELIGRIVSAVGEPLDGKGPVETSQSLPVERVAPGVITRQRVDTPLQTGIKAIDGMIPIGRGQRELIIGDRQTGKSAIALDTIINQKGQDVICIYCAIGQRAASVAQVAATLQEYESLEHTIIVAATAAEPAALQFMAPFAACAIGEYFMQNGRNALIVYDDLSKHAAAYRQLSLLLRRPPSREAYPGDIFYLHSRLLERAARMSDDEGGGSLTALPIIETQAGDIAGYIPTNVISITDGQIFLESDLFNSGVRPAISVGTSVSRVGGDAQTKAMKQVAGQLKLDLAQYRELAAFAQFSSDLDKGTRSTLERGQRMTELLKQDQYSSLSVGKQVITFFAGTHGLVDDIEIDRITEFERSLHRYIDSNHADLEKQISSGGKMDEGTERALEDAIKDFKRGFDGKVEEDEGEADEGEEEDGEERGRSEERPSGRSRDRDEDDDDADEDADHDDDDRESGKRRTSSRGTPPDPTSTSVVEKDGDRRTSEDEEGDDDGDDDREDGAARSRGEDEGSGSKRSSSDDRDGRDGDRKGDDRDGDRKGDDRDGERSSKTGAVRRRKG